jgi:anti-anti-sigma factor
MVVKAPGDGFAITRLRSGATVRVSVVGELDIATAPRLREQFEREKQEDLDAALLVDLQNVDFIDSGGLHLLQWAYDLHGNRLHIVLGTAAARLIDLTGLRDKLPIIDARDAPAVEAMVTGALSVQPRCSRCHEPIGMWEPVWVESPNGVQGASRLSLEDDATGGPRRFWHGACYAHEQR